MKMLFFYAFRYLQQGEACAHPQVRRLERFVSLEELKTHKDGALAGMKLFTHSRLSVADLTQQQWEFILSLARQEKPES